MIHFGNLPASNQEQSDQLHFQRGFCYPILVWSRSGWHHAITFFWLANFHITLILDSCLNWEKISVGFDLSYFFREVWSDCTMHTVRSPPNFFIVLQFFNCIFYFQQGHRFFYCFYVSIRAWRRYLSAPGPLEMSSFSM